MSKDAWSMFIMDLASYLCKSKADVLQMSSCELTDWMVYFKVKKLVGEDRADYRNAITAYTIASVMGSKKNKLQFTDFIPFYKKQMPKFNQLVEKLRGFVQHFKKNPEVKPHTKRINPMKKGK